MGYFFLVVVLFAAFGVILSFFKKEKLPSNNYTPYDDITNGRVHTTSLQQLANQEQEDSKHIPKYEDKDI